MFCGDALALANIGILSRVLPCNDAAPTTGESWAGAHSEFLLSACQIVQAFIKARPGFGAT